MEIVVDIPYNTIKNIRRDYGRGLTGLRDEDREIIVSAIYNCKPIPNIRRNGIISDSEWRCSGNVKEF